jgi:hypothetical protein
MKSAVAATNNSIEITTTSLDNSDISRINIPLTDVQVLYTETLEGKTITLSTDGVNDLITSTNIQGSPNFGNTIFGSTDPTTIFTLTRSIIGSPVSNGGGNTVPVLLKTYSDSALPVLDSELPSPSDTDWIPYNTGFSARGFNIQLTNLRTKNSMSGGQFMTFAVFHKNSANKITRIGTAILSTGTLFGLFSYSVPNPSPTGSLLFRFYRTLNRTVGNNGGTQFYIDKGVLKPQSSAITVLPDVPCRVTFDYGRGLGVSQFGASGCCGHLLNFDNIGNTISYYWDGYTPTSGTKFKIGSYIEVAYSPPPGIAFVADLSLVNTETNDIIIRGSIPPSTNGELYKVRLLGGTFAGVNSNTLVTMTNIVQLTSNTWRVKLINTNSNILNMADKGSTSQRWMFLTPLESPELTLLPGNQISLDGTTPLDLFYEIENNPITLTPGTPSVVNLNAHGFTAANIGQRFRLNSSNGTLPTNAVTNNNYVYLHSILDPNNFYLAGEPSARAPIVIGTGGANLTLTTDAGTVLTPTAISTGTAASCILPYHGMLNGGIGYFTATTLPVGYASGFRFTVNATNPQILTFLSSIGGWPLAFLSAGTGVTFSATNCRPSNQMFLTTYWMDKTPDGEGYTLAPSLGGSPFVINTPSTINLSFRFLDNVLITGEISALPFA